ncbi:MAG: LytTR family transcriptional regulator DNA-binding domain-containing protein [Blautia sp.]|nr:LytTR family transcriptional regulator DNA-binding domain-containing protein [Blautia sp.]
MINMLISDTDKEEKKVIEASCRECTAFNSEEKLCIFYVGDPEKPQRDLEKEDLFHLAIVDVCAGGGLALAEKLRELFPQLHLMVIAEARISPLAYVNPRIRATGLLLRPFADEVVRRTCAEFLTGSGVFRQDEDEHSFLVQNSEGKTLIPYRKIYYFEAREKKIFVRTKSREYGIYEVLDHLMQELPPEFLRCHRGFIINTDMFESVRFSENAIYLNGGISVPLSRSYKADVKEYMNGRQNK